MQNYKTLPLPETPGAEYVIGMLAEIGFAAQTSGGIIPISFSEIKAWSDCRGIKPTSWEAQTMREMSKAYCAGHYSGSEKGSFPPWSEEESQSDIKSRLKTALSTIKKKR